MSSGLGMKGTKGRCFDFWLDFRECVDKANTLSSCKNFQDDYLECLHHKKEYERYNRLIAEKNRQDKNAAKS